MKFGEEISKSRIWCSTSWKFGFDSNDITILRSIICVMIYELNWINFVNGDSSTEHKVRNIFFWDNFCETASEHLPGIQRKLWNFCSDVYYTLISNAHDCMCKVIIIVHTFVCLDEPIPRTKERARGWLSWSQISKGNPVSWSSMLNLEEKKV